MAKSRNNLAPRQDYYGGKNITLHRLTIQIQPDMPYTDNTHGNFGKGLLVLADGLTVDVEASVGTKAVLLGRFFRFQLEALVVLHAHELFHLLTNSIMVRYN